MALEQVDGEAAKPGEIVGHVPVACTALVFVEGHVEPPMPRILDAPMAANRPGETRAAESTADDEVPYIVCYGRKPRGLPDGIDPGPVLPVRFSFCCSVDGCRRRHTPPSVRFLGRKVYLSVMVVLLDDHATSADATEPLRVAGTFRGAVGQAPTSIFCGSPSASKGPRQSREKGEDAPHSLEERLPVKSIHRRTGKCSGYWMTARVWSATPSGIGPRRRRTEV